MTPFIAGDLPPNPLITLVTQEEIKEEPIQKIKKYTIKENDTLEKIAKKHDTTWLRLFYKNENIHHPDQLEVGTKIIIPQNDEELAERLYVIETPIIASPTQTAVRTAVNASNGWFPYGQCTYWVSVNRSVGQWNNASEWYWQAQRDGWSTGSTPKVGAIAWESNHVSLVTSVNKDGTVTVSEMNYKGLGVVSTRTASASQFKYIY
jgi:LysM repeat protein